MQNQQNISMGIIGHAKSGKSTLYHTLLYYQNVKGVNIGVTSHLAMKHLLTQNSNYTLIDIPGRIQYIKTIINGIALSDVILCVVSAIKTEFNCNKKQIKRYLQISHSFGIKQIIVALNKMDDKTIGYSQNMYNNVVNKMNKILTKVGYTENQIKKIKMIPISSFNQCNNIHYKSIINMEWYNGPSLMDVLNKTIKPPNIENNKPFKLSVSNVHRFGHIVIGKIISGKIKANENIQIHPSGIKGKIEYIQIFDKYVETAYCGYIIGMMIKCNESIKRGDVLSIDNSKRTTIIREFSALIYAQNSNKKLHAKYNNSNYLQFSSFLYINNGISKCNILSIKWKQNQSKKGNQKIIEPQFIEKGDKAKVIFELVVPIYIDSYKNNKKFGRFIIMSNGTENKIFIIGKVLNIIKNTHKQSIYMIGVKRRNVRFNLMDCNGYRGKLYLKNNISYPRSRLHLSDLTLINEKCKGIQSHIDSVYCGNKYHLFVCDSNIIPFATNISSSCVFGVNNMHQIYGIGSKKLLGINTICTNDTHRPQLINALNELNVYDIKSAFHYSLALCSSNNNIIDCVCKKIIKKIHKQIPNDIISLIKNYYQFNKVYATSYSWYGGNGRNCEIGEVTFGWIHMKELNGKHIIKIETGLYHSIFLDSNGTIWCCGRNSNGQLGLGTYHLFRHKYTPLPIKYFIENGIKIKDVKCGHTHNLAIDYNGNVYSWGDNDFGQCGDGTLDQIDKPKLIRKKNNNEVKAINCGAYHSYILVLSKSQICNHYLFGSNCYNECTLKDQTKEYVKSPQCINEIVKNEINCLEINGVYLGNQNTTLFVSVY